MKIAVTYENGQIFQHFGHTEQMKIYETADGKIVSAEVVSTAGSGHGALAGFLQQHGVDVLICGGIGGGAQTALAQAGIKFYGGCFGDADRAVQNLLDHTLMYNPNVKCDHHEHGHDCGHDCGSHEHHGCANGGCGGHNENSMEDQMITLTAYDENGKATDADFRVICVYPVNKQRYIAMTPDLDSPELEADIYLFRYLEDGDQVNVEEIVDDEEFAVAADAFQAWQLSRG